MFLKKFNIIEEDSEAAKILPSVIWIDEISDFTPAKMNEELMSILAEDRGRLCYLKVCERSFFFHCLFHGFFHFNWFVNNLQFQTYSAVTIDIVPYCHYVMVSTTVYLLPLSTVYPPKKRTKMCYACGTATVLAFKR